MRGSEQNVIRGIPPFCDISRPQFDALISRVVVHRFSPRTILFNEGQIPEFLHVLIDGTVELFGRLAGRETTFEILRPAVAFLFPSVVARRAYLESARTLSSGTLMMVPSAAFHAIYETTPQFCRSVGSQLVQPYERLIERLKDQRLRSGVARIAQWILTSDARQGGNGAITLWHDKRKLASQLGMTPENLSRNLARLAKRGIKSNGREITITDYEALRRSSK